MTSRRKFIEESCGALFCCSSLLMSGLESCVTYKYAGYEKEGALIKVKKPSFDGQDFLLLNYRDAGAPIMLWKKSDGEYAAVLLLCSHKGCTLRPGKKLLVCPCHGSEFSFDGKVVKGPAEKNLVTYETSTDDLAISVHINGKIQ